MTTVVPPSLPPGSGVKQTPGIAIASVVFGVISVLGGIFLLIPTLLAIILGHIAHARIRKDPALGGEGIALAGLVLGYLSIVVGGLLMAMAIPAFQKVRDAAYEKTMRNDARIIAAAAQQVIMERGEKPVTIQVDPETGMLSGDLAIYAQQITKGTRPIDAVISNSKDGFSLSNPRVQRGRELRFTADGAPLP